MVRYTQIKGLPKVYRLLFDPPQTDYTATPEYFTEWARQGAKGCNATPEQAADMEKVAALLGLDPVFPIVWELVLQLMDRINFVADEKGEKVPFADWRASKAALLPVPFPWLAESKADPAGKVRGIRIGRRVFGSPKDIRMAETVASVLADAVHEQYLCYAAIERGDEMEEHSIVRWVKSYCRKLAVDLGYWQGVIDAYYSEDGATLRNPRKAGRHKLADDADLVAKVGELLADHKLTRKGRLDALGDWWEKERGQSKDYGTLERQIKKIGLFLGLIKPSAGKKHKASKINF